MDKILKKSDLNVNNVLFFVVFLGLFTFNWTGY